MNCKFIIICFAIFYVLFTACKADSQSNSVQTKGSENDSVKSTNEITFKEIPNYGDAELFNLLYDFRDNANTIKSQQIKGVKNANYDKTVKKLSQLRQRINRKIKGMPEDEAVEVTKFLHKNEDNLNL